VSARIAAAAEAKINLALAVTGIRPDGYHELRSLFLRIALADALTVELREDATDTLAIAGDPGLPVEGNLVLRAAARLRAVLPDGADLPGLAFQLEKRIPVGGGLGGGSADAAAALRLALRAWGRVLPREELLAAAERVGADVPFLAGGDPAALVEGIGERIRPLPPLRSPLGILLLVPGSGLATPAVFRTHDAGPPPDGRAARIAGRLAEGWSSLGGPELAAMAAELATANDLWPAVATLDPALARDREHAQAALGIPLLLTGSGSTLVGLYPSPDAARRAAETFAGLATGSGASFRTIATADARPESRRGDPA